MNTKSRSPFRLLVLAAIGTLVLAGLASPDGGSARAVEMHDFPMEVDLSEVPARQGQETLSARNGVGLPDSQAPISDDVDEDLRHAAQQGVAAYEELRLRSVGHVEFDAAVAAATERFPGAVLEYGVNPSGGYWVEIGSGEPARVVSAFSEVPAPVEVTRRVSATMGEIEASQDALAGRLASIDVGSSFEVDYRADKGQLHVVVEVASNEAVGFATNGVTQSAMAVASTSTGGELPVTIRAFVELGEPTVELKGKRGGRLLRLQSSNNPECTGGFISRRNGENGLITAKHCANGLKYQYQDILSWVTGASDTPDGNRVDLQFHKFDGGVSIDRKFRATSTNAATDRPVTAVANAPVGSSICKWGHFSGYDCAIVVATGLCRDFGGPVYCGLDKLDSEITVNGDSGGPFFLGNTARGTLTGAIGNQDYLTRIGRVATNLNATVLTN